MLSVGKPDRFNECMKFVLKWEGGYSLDPNDPGGETKYGIDKRSHPDADIKNLTMEQALEIYHRDYWLKAGCDAMAPGWDLAAFDLAVNTGLGNVKPFLADANGDLLAFIARRVLYYFRVIEKRPASKTFLKGWLNRVSDLAVTLIQ